MSAEWIDTEFSDKAPTIDALEAQLDGESWSSRIQRDPLFAAQLAVVDCSDEVVKRTEHYEARIAELERRNALLTEFVVAYDKWLGWDGVIPDEYSDYSVGDYVEGYLGANTRVARAALTEDGFPWSDDQ